jgi:3-methylfumaryl-CoA hydratase
LAQDRAALEGLMGAIGRSVEAPDLVTPRLVASFRATLEPHLFPLPNGEAPLGIHWCLAPPLAPMDRLGRDGHPAETEFGFAPPLPRRMWAGGALELLAPIPTGSAVLRRSTFAGASVKEGRSGTLCFVTLRHDFLVEGAVAVSERQDLVYRDEAGTAAQPAAAKPAEPGPAAELAWRMTPNPVLLFRYSALSFNGHRIHYDQPYATEVEGQAGTLVHGPLQATWLLNSAASLAGRTPQRFEYRLTRPLACGQDCAVLAWRSGSKALECAVADGSGRRTATGAAQC